MDMKTYQIEARKTAQYPEFGNRLIYPTLGLTGEAGEVSEKVKKLVRDKNGEITEEFVESIKKELGDVLWYVANLAWELDLSLADVAAANIEKLRSRKERNVITGSGDNR